MQLSLQTTCNNPATTYASSQLLASIIISSSLLLTLTHQGQMPKSEPPWDQKKKRESPISSKAPLSSGSPGPQQKIASFKVQTVCFGDFWWPAFVTQWAKGKASWKQRYDWWPPASAHHHFTCCCKYTYSLSFGTYFSVTFNFHPGVSGRRTKKGDVMSERRFYNT